ncbi:hypothetical protein [Terriglobus sp. RCC_193]|uniref:hypothetical protein n=1 Tax=Terriglobus sp. RCC_193 TaxID=3239218 RepID=UPI0035269DA6
MNASQHREPRGFGEHARGPAAEKAHALGWDLDQEQRTALRPGKQNTYGGADYDYGAQDFGDEPLSMGATRTEEVRKALDTLTKED